MAKVTSLRTTGTGYISVSEAKRKITLSFRIRDELGPCLETELSWSEALDLCNQIENQIGNAPLIHPKTATEVNADICAQQIMLQQKEMLKQATLQAQEANYSAAGENFVNFFANEIRQPGDFDPVYSAQIRLRAEIRAIQERIAADVLENRAHFHDDEALLAMCRHQLALLEIC